MNERRRSLRGRLYFHRNGRTWHPCRIVDASYEGARIIVDNPNGIPDEIVLYIPKRKKLARASVLGAVAWAIWQRSVSHHRVTGGGQITKSSI